jgi:hypothetical protein
MARDDDNHQHIDVFVHRVTFEGIVGLLEEEAIFGNPRIVADDVGCVSSTAPSV